MRKDAEKILVSVIIPSYNRANTIERAIKSVLNQTYQNIELIIVDDGSTDNTEEKVKNIHDSRIVYIKHPANKGAPAARNTGIKIAKGKYIAFQDSDDEWFPQKLEKQIKIFITSPPEVGVVYTGVWRVENDNKKNYFPPNKGEKREGNIHAILLEKGNIVTNQAAVVLADCFKKAGVFDENFPRFQDWELFIRISKHYEFRFINEPLVISHIQKDSISVDEDALIKARELILKKYFDDIKKVGKNVLASHYYFLGRWFCQHDSFNHGKEYILKAVKAYPFKIKYLLIVIVSLFGSRFYDKLFKKKRIILQFLGFSK